MTGFRVARGGAQERYGVQPDLTTLGKIVGGGLPVGAYGGRRDLMERVSPAGPIYQAGTMSGNPLSMAAGLATLDVIGADPQFYARLERLGAALEDGLAAAVSRIGAPCTIARVGSMWTLFFTPDRVDDWTGAARGGHRPVRARSSRRMLARGVFLAPSQFEANFISAAHTPADIETTIAAAAAALETACA